MKEEKKKTRPIIKRVEEKGREEAGEGKKKVDR
jgi:hypothetical protein